MNPIERISVYYDQFSIAERKTCNLIIEDPQTVIDNPIAEAAKIYDVSTSSLLRVAKRMEYKGYSEFRYALKDWIKKIKIHIIVQISYILLNLINRISIRCIHILMKNKS